MLKKKIILIISLLLLSITGNVFAYDAAVTKSGIQYKMSPSNPAPGDYVYLNLYSYSIDLAGSNISYIVNGKLKKGGTGVRDFVFKVPDDGHVIKIDIQAIDFSGKIAKKVLYVRPVSLDLIYEVVEPYRPIFYKGKSTALSQSELKFFAFPNFKSQNGKKLDNKTLIYTWKLGDDFLKNASGIGRDILYLKKSYGVPRKTKITVSVRSLDGTMQAKQVIILESEKTKIDFYLDDTTMPFKFKNVAKANLITNSLDNNIVAIPYFFNDIKTSNVVWVINKEKVILQGDSNKLRMNIVKNKNNILVHLQTNLRIENEDRILQSVNANIVFKASQLLISQHVDNNLIKSIQDGTNSLFGL